MYATYVPVLSTCHIKPETAKFLEGLKSNESIAEYRGGFFIYAEGFEGSPAFERSPEDLQQVLRWAITNGHGWVRLDAEVGDAIDDLPNYEADWS